jgi:hypothetical protein
MVSPPVPAVLAPTPWVSLWLDAWGRPPDRPAQVALGVAVLLLAAAVSPGGPARVATFVEAWGVADIARKRRFVVVTAFAAAFLSLGYLSFYLRGGPRSPEAAAYWMQGRILSHGALHWTLPDPTASFRAPLFRFTAPNRLAGALAPGFPLLLSLGFLLGAPMIVGPLLAAALVVGTWLLGHEVAWTSGEPPAQAEGLARTAAGLSVVSVALRFQTSEALPHSAAALAVTMALVGAMRARRTGDARWFAAAGASVGAGCAAAPWSSVAIGVVVLAMIVRADRPARTALWAVLSFLPGALFLLAAQRAATGHAFVAAKGVAQSAMTFSFPATARAALVAFGRASLHGARQHLADVANFEPIALAPLALVFGKGRTRAAVLPAVVIAAAIAVHALQVASHTPVAIEGVARWARSGILVEVLPIEHALVALALARVFPAAIGRAALALFSLALGGFAVHVAYDHEKIANSGNGRPHYEPDVPRDVGITHGLLLFDDDDGYELAADPDAIASHGIEAARSRGDDHDRLLFDILGHPPAHRYVVPKTGTATLPTFTPGNADSWRFEAEADLNPPGGSIVDAVGCGTDARAVAVDAEGAASIELPIPRGAAPPERRTWQIAPRVLDRGGHGSATLELFAAVGGPALARWTWTEAAKSPRCFDLAPQAVELGGDRSHAWWVLTAHGGSAALDRTVLRPK